MRDTVKINDPNLDRAAIARQLQAALAQMPPLPDLAQTGPAKLHRAAILAPGQNDTDLLDFNRDLIGLIDNATLQETEFSSNAPVIGPFIVKFRQLWNWMSTRWYVLPIIRQQSDVNMQMAIMLVEMAQLQALHTRHIVNLQEKINRLEEHIRQQKEQ